jgi:hypothetical protein
VLSIGELEKEIVSLGDPSFPVKGQIVNISDF